MYAKFAVVLSKYMGVFLHIEIYSHPGCLNLGTIYLNSIS